MSIKVLVISRYSRFHIVRPEAEIFIGLSELGFDVHVMGGDDSPYADRFREHGITFTPFHPKGKFDRRESDKIREYIVTQGIQVLHLFNTQAIHNGIRAAKRLDVKVVLYRGFAGHIHWYDPLSYLKYLHPRVDAIFCVSQGVEDSLKRQMVFVKNKTVTINKGHNPSWYDYEPANIREELGVSKEALLLIDVANNRKMKGIPYLMKALNLLPVGLDIQVLLVGRDMDTPENRRILAKGTYADNVHFMGYREDVLNLVAASDLFVLPSIYGEGIAKSVLEAMSMGVGAIISNISGSLELVEHGVNGLIFPSKNAQALADAMLKVYENRELVKQFGDNSRKRIETVLSNEQAVLKTKKLYEDLVAN